MSDIKGELARVREVFNKPTLCLLDRQWAPLALAVFKSSFSLPAWRSPACRWIVCVTAAGGNAGCPRCGHAPGSWACSIFRRNR